MTPFRPEPITVAEARAMAPNGFAELSDDALQIRIDQMSAAAPVILADYFQRAGGGVPDHLAGYLRRHG